VSGRESAPPEVTLDSLKGWKWKRGFSIARDCERYLYSRDGSLRGVIARTANGWWLADGRWNGWFPCGWVDDEARARVTVETAVAAAMEADE
jgi:hypothetical protein